MTESPGAPVSDLPQPDRGRRPANARHRRRADFARAHRGADRHSGLRLDGAAGMEHPRRLARRAPRGASATSPTRTCTFSVTACRSTERLSLDELRPHLFSDPERPEVIPYRTSYHNENWGFCLPHERARAAARRRVRGRDRLDPRGREPDLRGARRPRRERRRSAAVDLRLPPLAGQRQPLGHRAADRARASTSRARAGATRTASCSARRPWAR